MMGGDNGEMWWINHAIMRIRFLTSYFFFERFGKHSSISEFATNGVKLSFMARNANG